MLTATLCFCLSRNQETHKLWQVKKKHTYKKTLKSSTAQANQTDFFIYFFYQQQQGSTQVTFFKKK